MSSCSARPTLLRRPPSSPRLPPWSCRGESCGWGRRRYGGGPGAAGRRCRRRRPRERCGSFGPTESRQHARVPSLVLALHFLGEDLLVGEDRGAVSRLAPDGTPRWTHVIPYVGLPWAYWGEGRSRIREIDAGDLSGSGPSADPIGQCRPAGLCARRSMATNSGRCRSSGAFLRP